ncbi:MAG: TonB-dependent receptor [Salinibacter sp.]
MRFATTLLSAVLFAALGTLSLAHAQSADLHGIVTDAQGRPLPNGNVVLKQADGGAQVAGTSTRADGTFRIEEVSPGTYQLVVSAIGYQAATQTVTLDAGTQRRVSLQLQGARYGLDEVVVSATRSRETLGSVASSISVLGTEALATQGAITSDLGAVLAQTVPGLAPSSGSLSNYGQTLRGRSPLIMIDGVPQNTPLRDAARSLRTTSPEVIERIEVVRGANALYGYGATGGAINIITKEPTPGLEATTEVGVRGSTADVSESFTGRLHQSVSGKAGGIGFVASGSYERWGQFFDAKERLLPQDPRGQGGLAGADEISLFGKVEGTIGAAQHLTASLNYYSFLQDMKYGREAGTYGETPTSATSPDDIPGKDPGTKNLVGQVRYEHGDLLGSEVTARAYVQDFKTRFGYSQFYPGGGQGFVESTKFGVRVDATTPLGLTEESQLLWGIDALRDQTAQPLEDGRIFVPEITQMSAAPFAQLRVPVANRLTLRGGVRYEALALSVDDFTTLRKELDTDGDGTPDTRNDVKGGTLTYDNMVFNVGAVVTVAEPIDVFASFEQGFSVSDVGRVLRGTSAPSVEKLSLEAKTVNSYELGTRVGTSTINASVAGFYSASELGSTYGSDLEIIRSPERIYGVEASVDVQVADPLKVGGSFTWLEGKRDANGDGSYDTYLPGNRIPPTKITGYVKVTPIDGVSGRLQVFRSGSRDRFKEGDRTYGEGPIESYTLVDLSGQVDVGPGTLALGVQNLFDNYYFPVRSQFTNFGFAYTPGRGRNVSLSYTVKW